MAEAKVKFTTPKFRAAFANVFEARAMEEGGTAKFSVSMIFDKEGVADPKFKALKKAINQLMKEKFGSLPEKQFAKLKHPLRDCEDRDDMDGYSEGHTFASASSLHRPGIIDKNKNTIVEEDDEFYSGCYARATVTLYSFDKGGNKGVAIGLQNLQKLKDGEHFSGRVSAENDFDDDEDEDDEDFDD